MKVTRSDNGVLVRLTNDEADLLVEHLSGDPRVRHQRFSYDLWLRIQESDPAFDDLDRGDEPTAPSDRRPNTERDTA